jgi:hypothetical protein
MLSIVRIGMLFGVFSSLPDHACADAWCGAAVAVAALCGGVGSECLTPRLALILV